MKKTFVFSLKLKDCDKVFKEGFGPGVLVTQEITFNDKDTRGFDSPMFAMALINQEEDFLKRYIEVIIAEKEK